MVELIPYLYLLRHAQSEFNAAMAAVRRRGGKDKELHQVKFDARYMDAKLTERGRRQAIDLVPLVRKLSINKVFVSPLRRALETAAILFLKHPNNPNIVVLPNLTEQIKTTHGISVGLQIDELPTFNWTLLPEYHYILDIVNETEASLILDRSKTQPLHEVILSRLIETFPNPLESDAELELRVQGLVSYLRQEASSSNICVISHSHTSKHLIKNICGPEANGRLFNGQLVGLALNT